MADEQTFDPHAFIENYSTPDLLPELKPSKTTFYFPASPEETRKAGLSYKMEGGTQGGGRFRDIHLPDHTLEKYDSGESKFVAIAMPGVPTGSYYRMPFPDGAVRTVRNVDTGGGLVPGQADIATSNPDLARGGGGGAAPESHNTSIPSTNLRPVSEEEIDAIVGTKKEEPKGKSKPSRSRPAFTPIAIPAGIDIQALGKPQPLDIPQQQSFAAIPKTDVPSPSPQPLPAPTPDFGMPVQEAINQSPKFVSEPFDPRAFIAQYSTPSVTPSPTPVATETPTPAAFNPRAFIAQYTSPTEVPQPRIAQTTSGIGQVIQGFGEAGMDALKGLIPNPQNIRSFGTIMAAPVHPEDVVRMAAQTALNDAILYKEAKKAGLLSKQTGKLVGHLGMQAAGALPALKTGAALRVADEAASIPKPPIQDASAVPTTTGKIAETDLPSSAQQTTVTSEIANRFLPERQLANELGAVTPDGPIIPSEVIAAASKLPPEGLAQLISDLVHNSGGSTFLQQSAAVVVREAQLSERSSALSKIARQNPTQANKIAAEEAFNEVTDFHNGPVTKMKGIWSAGGKVMQSGNPIDLASLNGQREAWLRDVGSAPPPEALPRLQELADNMFKANQRMTDLQQMWRADADSLKPRVTPEMVREQILAKLKKMTPC